MMVKRKFFIHLIVPFIMLHASIPVKGQALLPYLPLIPKPLHATELQGNFILDSATPLYYYGEGSLEDAQFFNQYLEQYYGFKLNLAESKRMRNGAINIHKTDDTSTLPPDAYDLKVSSGRVEILGGKSAGAFYGIQTLIQLLPAGSVSSLSIPAIQIKDQPGFAWRGMHLDVARHFFPVSFIKQYIDLIASYKMNTFHWHLTDDQGWRIEIKKYPKLQEISAWRSGTLLGHLSSRPEQYDSLRYGGYYTQEEIREIVSYAAARHITIVPEIEMPGHVQALIAAYPELACTPGPFETGKKWGVFRDVLCPKQETFEFIANVLTEVASLFPGTYIHVGGDECPKDRWKESEFCQDLIKKEGLKDENGLQSYFMHRVEKILHSLNKRMIGWDEILDGGIAADATVMSWRGYKGAVDAALAGHDVVMSPTSFCYFDFYQSKYPAEPLAIGEYLPLERVYQFEPVPDVLTPEQSKHILGAQGNVWTEYMKDTTQVEYMVLPRMAALAEILWSPRENRNYDDFTTRLVSHFKLLGFKKMNYSQAMFDINEMIMPEGNKGALSISLSSPFRKGVLHYTINGEEPSLATPEFKDKIVVDQSVGIRARLFDGTNPRGREYSKVFKINLATGKEIILSKTPHEEFSRGGGFSLVNGVTGNLPWIASDWIGFLGDDLDAVIDLGRSTTIRKVGVDLLKDENSRIYFPQSIEVLVSDDGIVFTSVKKMELSEYSQVQRLVKISTENAKGRWLRVIAKNAGTILPGRPGAGGPAWLLLDEITVD